MELLSGTANPLLANEVASKIGVTLADSEVIRFLNSEIRVRIIADCKGQECIVIQPVSNPTDTHFVELLFFADALKRGEAAKITAIIPYLGYARQNIQHRPGEAVSAHVVVKMIEAVGIDEVITLDLHDEATAGIFSIPFTNLSALPLFADQILADGAKPEECVVISPDQGGVERARTFANAFFGSSDEEVAMVEKKRDLGHIHESTALELFGEVEGKTAILVDDIVTSGGTLLNAAKLCLDKGATKVIAAVTHHDFAPDTPTKIQDSAIEKFYTTDTISLADDQKFEKLVEISAAEIIADTLKK